MGFLVPEGCASGLGLPSASAFYFHINLCQNKFEDIYPSLEEFLDIKMKKYCRVMSHLSSTFSFLFFFFILFLTFCRCFWIPTERILRHNQINILLVICRKSQKTWRTIDTKKMRKDTSFKRLIISFVERSSLFFSQATRYPLTLFVVLKSEACFFAPLHFPRFGTVLGLVSVFNFLASASPTSVSPSLLDILYDLM